MTTLLLLVCCGNLDRDCLQSFTRSLLDSLVLLHFTTTAASAAARSQQQSAPAAIVLASLSPGASSQPVFHEL
ncbi:MAG: hypothetical protein MHMPM18_004524 [Marteilia pararefringens]